MWKHARACWVSYQRSSVDARNLQGNRGATTAWYDHENTIYSACLSLTIALRPQNLPTDLMKTCDTSHGCSGSLDSWPDQEANMEIWCTKNSSTCIVFSLTIGSHSWAKDVDTPSGRKNYLSHCLRWHCWIKYCLRADWHVNACWPTVQNYFWFHGFAMTQVYILQPIPWAHGNSCIWVLGNKSLSHERKQLM